MKRFGLLAVLLGLVLTISAAWSADDPKKPTADDKKEPAVKGQLPANYKKLGLTDDQTKKIYKLEADYKSKIAALEDQIKDLKAKEKTEIEAVLTADQKARLKEIRSGDEKKP